MNGRRNISLVSTTTLLAFWAACTAPRTGALADPARAEVRLGSQSGWNASLVIDTEPVGIWTVAAMKVFPQYACPEVVGLDDLGRCHVLVSYSGKWTPFTTIADGEWLGGLAQGDVDPAVPGVELYTGGKRGNLYQVVAHREGVVDHRRVAHLPGREIHTLIAADWDAGRPGDELLAFTRPGGLFLLTPRDDGRDGFDAVLIEDLEGRVRDARVLPRLDASAPLQIATVSRAGRLALLQPTPDGPLWTTLFECSMGMGRLALKPASDSADSSAETVLYTTHDDGRIMRHERAVAGDWSHELIYAGSQGPRGVAAGRFHADPNVESVVVFGYSGRVELLTRRSDGWHCETLFEDRDKGHWVAAAELDGRNATDEVICSGYGGRIVLLSRPPGFGRPGVLAHSP